MTKPFSFELNSKDITKALNKAAKETGNLEAAFKIARQKLLYAIDENFETEGQFSGERFREWSDDYAKYRSKKGRGQGKILQLEGYLRKSLTSKISRYELIIGTNKEYAAAQNFGYAPNNLEARPFMRISDTTRKEIAGAIEKDLMKRLGKI